MGSVLAGTIRVLAGAAVALGAPLFAQDAKPARSHVVHGVVFDSVAGAALAGAEVHVAARDASGTPVTATTDFNGRYRIPGLASGEYVIGFYHASLDALGLDAPQRRLVLSVDTLVTVDLGIPSGKVLRALRCGADSSANAGGMLAGFLRNAESHAAVAGAAVRVAWGAFAFDAGNFRVVQQQAVATIEADGSYIACRLPIDAPLDLIVTAPGHRPIAGLVTVPVGNVARVDLYLADSTAVHGAAILRGRVVRANGRKVTSGRAVITAAGRDVPVQDGAFVLTDLPLGSWVVETRVIGVEPQSTLVNVMEGAVASTTITVSDHAQRLDAVTVIGERDRNVSVLEDVLRRQRSSSGSFFYPGHPALRGALHTADVLKEARGFRYVSPTKVSGRPPVGITCKGLAVYINGVKTGFNKDGLEVLDYVAPVNNVLAIEAYPDVLFTPMQWRTGDACSVVVVWTKQ